MALENDRDNRLEVFKIGPSLDFSHTREDIVGSGDWSEWNPLRPSFIGTILAVKKRNDDMLEVFAIDDKHNFCHIIQQDPTTKSWSDWAMLGKSSKSGMSLAVEKRMDGMLEVFAIDMSFNFWHIWQKDAGPNEWSDWERLGRPTIKGQNLVVAIDKTKRLQAFAIDTYNRVWRKFQNSPATGDWSWSDWERLGGEWFTAISLAVATNNDGRLEVFAIDTDNRGNHFWHIWQIAPNDPKIWANDWVQLGGQSDRGTTLAVQRNGNGILEAFTIAIDAVGIDPSSLAPPDIRHTWQDYTNPIPNTWKNWTSL